MAPIAELRSEGQHRIKDETAPDHLAGQICGALARPARPPDAPHEHSDRRGIDHRVHQPAGPGDGQRAMRLGARVGVHGSAWGFKDRVLRPCPGSRQFCCPFDDVHLRLRPRTLDAGVQGRVGRIRALGVGDLAIAVPKATVKTSMTTATPMAAPALRRRAKTTVKPPPASQVASSSPA